MIGRNIKRYRKILGITQEEISKEAGISRQTLSKIENNKTEPNSNTLMEIAKVLDIKLEELFRERESLEKFRINLTEDYAEKNEEEISSVLKECSFWLSNYQMLEEQLNQSNNWSLADLDLDEPENLANTIREQYVDFTTPIYNPITIMNELEIRVFLFESKLTKLESFSGYDKFYQKPYIALNNNPKINHETKVFSLFKELSHLVSHGDSYNGQIEKKQKSENKQSNTFASYFLISRNDFRKKLEKVSGLHWVKQVLYLKRYFRVSYLKILRRLPDEGVIGKNLLGDFISDYNQIYEDKMEIIQGLPEEPFPIHDLNFENIKLHRLVKKALKSNLISPNKAAEILSITAQEMKNIIRSWEEVKEIFIEK